MPLQKLPRLGDLDFGRLSAADEASISPELLKSGYFDFQQAAYKIALGHAWLLIGPKGAGKSASFEHLALLWESSPMKFLSRWELGSFPVADVTTLKVGSQPGPTASRAAWEFLLLLKVFESHMRDNGAAYGADITRLRSELTAAGLIEGPDLKTRFVDWSKSTVKFNVLGLGAEGAVADSAATAMQVTEILKRGLSTIRTNSQHLLAVDGLDSFFAQSDQQLESLAALVDATAGVNAFLNSLNLRSSVVLAIRSDMFAQLPSTDSAKMTDHAIELDWSRGGMSEGNELWTLINTKARASVLPSFEGRPLKDVRSGYLNTPIGIGAYDKIPQYFLSHTRLLPRDLIALMTELKGLHTGSGQVTEQTARETVRLYCETYFIREITNGLSKVLPGASANKVSTFIDALSTLQNRHFRAADLTPETTGVLDPMELRTLLRQLYTIGGLGVQSGRGSVRHTNFVFRRTAGGGFSFVADYTLHSSLVVAWNLTW
ncbi:energy-coupling factor transporter ATP-binding protein EcfA2 [Leifsonia sp. EB41]|uniref:P-loop ATPase, Sll1717 family n=1 Tax=Leifsonia sp. EB41 TaxID=3156260 RepID=UPI0035114B59